MDATVKWVALTFLVLNFCLFANGELDTDLSQKIAELRLKSNAHGKIVTQILSNELKVEPIAAIDKSSALTRDDAVQKQDVTLSVVEIPNEEIDDAPGQDIIEVVQTNQQVDQPQFSNEIQDEPSSTSGEISSSIQAKQTYEELYAPKIPQRRVGYYFGPFLGSVFPDDSAVKENNGATSYNSKGGVVGGFRLGNDFGSARIEAEYAFVSHKIASIQDSGRSNLHNVCSRLLLEKNLGEQADIRAGIGLGIGFTDLELAGKEYNGIGFSYDFLLGWSYRIMNNWSLNLDYRHYLTASHENYDRLQGHIIELSAGFDL